MEERLELWHAVIASEDLSECTRIDTYVTGLVVDHVRGLGGHVMVKGLRSPNDFDAEFQQGSDES